MTDNTQSEALAALIERFRGLHIDHKPDGWPAVRTREITALLDRIAELEAQLEAIGAGGVSALMGAAKAGSEPVATVFTMEALTPGGGVKYHATIHKPLPAGTKLYAAPQPASPADGVLEDAARPELDAWKCERCHGTGWHWQSESVNHGKEIGVENVDLKTHCDACEGVGWCGMDAAQAAAAEQGGVK